MTGTRAPIAAKALLAGDGNYALLCGIAMPPPSLALLFKYRSVPGDFAPQAALLPPETSPAFWGRCSLLPHPASQELARGWGWWGVLEPPSPLRLAASGDRAPPAPGGEGELCWPGSVPLHRLLAPGMLQTLRWSLEASRPARGGCGPERPKPVVPTRSGGCCGARAWSSPAAPRAPGPGSNLHQE